MRAVDAGGRQAGGQLGMNRETLRRSFCLTVLALLLSACSTSRSVVIERVRFVYEPQHSAWNRLYSYPGSSEAGRAPEGPANESGPTILATLAVPLRTVRVHAWAPDAFESFEKVAAFLHAILNNKAQIISRQVYWSQPLSSIVIADVEVESGSALPLECAWFGAFFRDPSGAAWWMLPSPFPGTRPACIVPPLNGFEGVQGIRATRPLQPT